MGSLLKMKKKNQQLGSTGALGHFLSSTHISGLQKKEKSEPYTGNSLGVSL